MQSLVDVLFLVCIAGNCSVVEDFELQRQVICALNSVLYEQLQYKGNECDYYNPLNSYIHQVDFPEILYLQGVKLLNNFQIILLCGIFSLIFLVIVQVLLRRTGIPISLSVLYMTLAQRLGVQLEPVNFPNHFLLRWCQKPTGYSFHLKKKKFRSSYWLKFKLSCMKFMEGKAWRRGINNQDQSIHFQGLCTHKSVNQHPSAFISISFKKWEFTVCDVHLFFYLSFDLSYHRQSFAIDFPCWGYL